MLSFPLHFKRETPNTSLGYSPPNFYFAHDVSIVNSKLACGLEVAMTPTRIKTLCLLSLI